MISTLGLVIYFTLGLVFSILIVIYNDKFAHMMGWSLLKIKKAQLQSQGIKEKKQKIEEYEDHIINEIDKPAPDPLVGIFYLFLLITVWPLVGLLPLFALLLDVFYLTD